MKEKITNKIMLILLVSTIIFAIAHMIYINIESRKLEDFYAESEKQIAEIKEERSELISEIRKKEEKILENYENSKLDYQNKNPITAEHYKNQEPKLKNASSFEPETLDIPDGNNSFYGFMDYDKVTDPTSDQYNFKNICWIDDMGLYRQCNDYVIALGSFYGHTVGERYIITLQNGTVFTAVLGDLKSDADTDPTNRYRLTNDERKNVIEFIVDTDRLSNQVKQSGNIGSYSMFNSDIASISKI